jgi:hypothetical protein
MKKEYVHNYRIEKEEIVISKDETEKQLYFKGYISHIGKQLSNARDKEELIDMLEWWVYKVKYNDGL